MIETICVSIVIELSKFPKIRQKYPALYRFDIVNVIVQIADLMITASPLSFLSERILQKF